MRLLCALLSVSAVMLCGCGRSSDEGGAGGNRIQITGSSTVAPLVAELARRYEAAHPGVRIDVQAGGSSRGIADARGGLADIGMISRGLKSDEDDLRGYPIAHDGICMIVHNSNKALSVSDAQVVQIFNGEVNDWSLIGGPDAEITVVHKAEGRSTQELFLKHFKMRNTDVEADVIIGDNEQGIKTVAGNPHAIGYVSIGAAEYSAKNGVDIRLMPVGGVQPSVESVRNGLFPLSRPLTLVTAREPDGLAADFIRFARSAKAEDIVTSQHFVPLSKPEGSIVAK